MKVDHKAALEYRHEYDIADPMLYGSANNRQQPAHEDRNLGHQRARVRKSGHPHGDVVVLLQ